MDRVKDRAESLLAAARESEAGTAELFTRFGCHAFAFTAVQRFGGTAVLMTEMWDSKWGPTRRVHAWCETGSAAIDYFGKAEGAKELLQRFLSQPGFSPPWHAGMAPSKLEILDRSLIDQVIVGSRSLPKEFYGDLGWMRRAMSLADSLLADPKHTSR